MDLQAFLVFAGKKYHLLFNLPGGSRALQQRSKTHVSRTLLSGLIENYAARMVSFCCSRQLKQPIKVRPNSPNEIAG